MNAVSDPVKPTSRAAISALKGMGFEVAMLTGDNARTAQAISRQAGIDDVVAEAWLREPAEGRVHRPGAVSKGANDGE